jgi:hypothetical protein
MKALRLYFVPTLLVSFVLLLAFWIVMAKRSRQPLKAYDLTAREIVGLQPTFPGWNIRLLPVNQGIASGANILAMDFARDTPEAGVVQRFMIRLVHGYNMPMCMKKKYYTVEKIQDSGIHPVSDPKLQSAFRPAPRELNNLTTQQLSALELPVQLWRLTSSAGTVSIWATTVIRSGDFAPTTEDICSMAFPRIDTLDDPNWVPRGLTRDDLKHPIRSYQRWRRLWWDDSRWDLLTFLRFRPPVFGSAELLSYVTLSVAPDVTSGNEATIVRELLVAHSAMLDEMRRWKKEQTFVSGIDAHH